MTISKPLNCNAAQYLNGAKSCNWPCEACKDWHTENCLFYDKDKSLSKPGVWYPKRVKDAAR